MNYEKRMNERTTAITTTTKQQQQQQKQHWSKRTYEQQAEQQNKYAVLCVQRIKRPTQTKLYAMHIQWNVWSIMWTYFEALGPYTHTHTHILHVQMVKKS